MSYCLHVKQCGLHYIFIINNITVIIISHKLVSGGSNENCQMLEPRRQSNHLLVTIVIKTIEAEFEGQRVSPK